MSLVARVKEVSAATINALYGADVKAEDILVSQTKPEFEGDYTVVLFALVKSLRKAPEQLGQELGARIVGNKPRAVYGLQCDQRIFEPVADRRRAF
jgi:arginyl-tRNA synthetase